MAAALLDKSVPEELPSPPLDASSEQPPLFDGTIRLYATYACPYVRRAMITRNYKGLQGLIKLVPINLQNRPAWYPEKVYHKNKVPALEHNGKVIGESLDVIKYLDANFDGPSLLPQDPVKRKFADELFSYGDTFNMRVYTPFKGDPTDEASPVLDYLENALHKFEEGPFFLGQFSLVDIAYIPFIETFQIFLNGAFNYNITTGRPKLLAWLEEMNKIQAYKLTITIDPEDLVKYYKKTYMVHN